MKFSFSIPAWLGRLVARPTMDTAQLHGYAGKSWRFLQGGIDINMKVVVEEESGNDPRGED